MPRNTRVSGHWLIQEGWPHDSTGRQLRRDALQGRGKCSCGALSDWLPTTAARQRWHRYVHKLAVLEAQSK